MRRHHMVHESATPNSRSPAGLRLPLAPVCSVHANFAKRSLVGLSLYSDIGKLSSDPIKLPRRFGRFQRTHAPWVSCQLWQSTASDGHAHSLKPPEISRGCLLVSATIFDDLMWYVHAISGSSRKLVDLRFSTLFRRWSRSTDIFLVQAELFPVIPHTVPALTVPASSKLRYDGTFCLFASRQAMPVDVRGAKLCHIPDVDGDQVVTDRVICEV